MLKAHAYEGMKDLLLYLHEKGYQLGVATYKREDMAKRVLEHCGIASCFDSIQFRMPPENTPKQMLSATASTHWV